MLHELTTEQQDALDYLVDMARGHDYAEVAKISAAEDTLLDAFADRARLLADERERIAQEIEAAAQRLRNEGGRPDLNLGQWSGLNRMADTFEMAADIARGQA